LVEVDGNVDGLIGTDGDALAAAAARIADHRPLTVQADGVDETCPLRARPAGLAALAHRNRHSGHSGDTAADARGDIRQHPPQATARAAVADGEQPLLRADAEPHGVELIAADQMHQTGLPAPLHVGVGFLSAHRTTESRIDAKRGLAEEKTSQVPRVGLAVLALAADAEIHDPVMRGLVDEVLHHSRGEHDAGRGLGCLVDGNHPVARQLHDVVALKKPLFQQRADDRRLRQSRDGEAPRKGPLDQLNDPEGTSHVRSLAIVNHSRAGIAARATPDSLA
jgi:hypothetical protein